jgi:PAS domain S-box-containing protein
VKQENKSGIATDENTESFIESALPRTIGERQVRNRQQAAQFWAPFRWLQVNSFTPTWLPKSLRNPMLGYFVAILLQIIAVLITMSLVQLYPLFAVTGLLGALAVALIALNWGAGPSLLATLAGVVLLNFVIMPPHFAWTFSVGSTISIVASQIARTRHNAEELATSLMTERARLEVVIEAVPGAVSIYDAQGRIVRLNRMGLENTGLERSKDTLEDSQHTYAVRTPTGEPLPLENFPVTRALRGETVSGVEIQFVDAEGQDRFASLSATPLHDAGGKIDGVIVISHDITTLHQSQREAEARANELETIFEAMTDSIFVFDRAGQILRMNAAARELLAFDAQPEHHYHFVPYDENGQPLPEEQWPLYRVLHGETLTSANAMDIRMRSSDGQELQLNISGAPMHNKEGTLIGAVCICRDVTERRQLEKRTQDTLNALLAMAETLVLTPDSSTPSGPLTTANGYVPTGVSRVAQRLVELTRSVLGCERVTITTVEPETNELHSVAAIGLTTEEESHWRNRTPGFYLSDLLSDPAHGSQLLTNEAIIVDMTQSPFSTMPNPYNISVMLIAPMSVGEQLVGILSLDYEGKEHQYTPDEISLAKAVAKLAALVIERDRLLRERAEARANELALREANRRMDEFLGMTSHELKTPLTSIKGNTQLTVRQLRNSMQNIQKMQDMFESTERQIKLLDRLVDDLLDFSRTQANTLELNFVRCDLATLVCEAVEEQRRVWPTRTITLDLPAESTVSISADPDRISQVMTNYLTNALKYSSEDLHVTLKLESDNARVSVQDHGVGLSPEEQKRVWERFYRTEDVEVLSNNAQSSMMGLGLGLYICKTIIDQHHGNVGVESTPHVGSTFWFTLPLAREDN